jgi:hypothetical protein
MAAYGTLAGVAALCKQRTEEGDWSDSMGPSAAQVTSWLAKGYADLNVRMAQAGYGVPVTDVTIVAYDMLRHLNDLYAAAMVEIAWDTATGSAEEETRGDRFLREYKQGIANLLEGDATVIGLSLSGSAPTRRGIRFVNVRREDAYSQYTGEYEQEND